MALDFDSAIAALRRVAVGGEPLPPLAHAAGRPTAAFAADLHAFLRDLDRAIHVAERTESRVLKIGARGVPDEVVDLPPGWTSHPRPERPQATVRASPPADLPVIAFTAHGEAADPDALPPGYRIAPRGHPL